MTGPGSLTPQQQEALATAVSGIRTEPASVHVRFPAAARDIARSSTAASEVGTPRIEDEVRVRLLEAFAAQNGEPQSLAAEIATLYRYGDADERRAVLLSLHRLNLQDRAIDLVHDALRSNDPRLVAAALGEYGRRHLTDADWRQGVLKCLFVGVPLRLVAGLPERSDDTLREMVAAYARERTAAGREVPEDARRLLDPTDPSPDVPGPSTGSPATEES